MERLERMEPIPQTTYSSREQAELILPLPVIPIIREAWCIGWLYPTFHLLR